MSNDAANPAADIVTRRFKNGSIIYFEGDRSDYVYILKSGRVILTYIKIDTGEEIKENIKIGEFFGVKSAIGRFPREETAQTVGDTIVLAVTRADFEKMILKNVALVTKMLRVFSNQLRKIHRMNREALGQNDSIDPAAELFKIGEYYYKSGSSQQALYSYKRYLEHYPGTKFSEVAMQRIRAIETGSSSSDFQGELSMDENLDDVFPVEKKANDDVDLADFSLDDEDSKLSSGLGKGEEDFDFGSDPISDASLSTEMDDFFGNTDNEDFGDFFSDDTEINNNLDKMDITEMFYEAVSLYSQEDYEKALKLYEKILDFKTLKDNSEKKIYEKAHFEIGRCYLKLGSYNESVKSLSAMIKKFSNSEYVKNSLFHIGMAFEAAGTIDKAIAYYKKVISMEPKDSINKMAFKRMKSFQK